ncbi:MAG TPA: hypothetical protein VK335_20515 [Bryobacteraceae bacterium]|nr:hypothetical protein [Bryobacteraceae bacterium]
MSKSLVQRTITNTLPDGSTVKYADPGAPFMQWNLQFQGLSDSEAALLQQFFAICEGQLNAFTFTDPLGNLLVWSEDFTQPAWQTSTLLQFVTGAADPNGGTSATQVTNPTGADLTVQQTIRAPGWYSYCFSAYVQSQSGVTVCLLREAGGISNTSLYTAGVSWQRVTLMGQTSTTAETVTVGITIPAGQSVTMFGFQLEPQPGVSPYKPSYETGGVYTNAHFSGDTLAVTTTAPDRNQCTLTITAH